ncbi:hemerythrin domain-containing protein [Ralstonia pickettii]|uniref:hemerythrin domain-containing protein n=1 Tax=Ralstonia pickettii TaxID=329 RepID=UPI0027146C76|nr:hemerythrin domain-containing protein [Ralstonia pickettii]WKZ86477.1 hemerythrin domain-containing protein [Ralstonia pickettii]
MNKTDIPKEQKSVLSLLLDDHREVKRLFKAFEKAEPSEKGALVSQACAMLTAHTKLEETIFYPFVRDQAPEKFGDLLDEALVEHASAKSLIAELSAMKPGDALYDAKFTVLGEYVNHHVEEEESELFPKIIKQHVDLSTIEEQVKDAHASLAKEAA